ncbi:MAG: nitrous oxide reductase family maturation protein NosD [Pseudomonas sp.]|jgi:nitrous oxidase accessory protein|nr:nitrous oxide reductase family maturation protein NosD [Pseudomonas sp.]MDD2222209.1 nitrous oxide reductase family maturation protein NosD [Pseudomonas sp.]MDY0413531.1 nitrous oxide reductase family maturation protein NosD [Pseudomonas sp.]NLO54385.1 nitrous oxide reductase family maturation protein NosD [Gammaproteobacteria bacterium]
MIRGIIYSVALLLVLPVYAAEEVPDALKDVQLHEIQAAPDADLQLQSITQLPLEKVSEQHWRLPAGDYIGHFVIDQPMTFECAKDAYLRGGGLGNALNIRAADVSVINCDISQWGHNLTQMDAGIFIERTAKNARIENNFIHGQGFGVWVDATHNVSIINNKVQGDLTLRNQDRGNGIHLFAVRFANISGNEIWETRDGIYIEAANDNIIHNNHMRDLRYGVHYMFSNRNEVTDNSTTRTRTGYALMQSRQLTVTGNRSDHDQNYGILMNYITYSTLKDNFVTAVQPGSGDGVHISGAEGKALFIYNSLFNTLTGNHFEHSALGIHLTAGSEDNRIYHNSFIGNQQQVKYVAIRYQEWSYEGKGNYWSDYLGWDRNSDGIGDVAYEPNDNVDRLLWIYPQVRLLMHSPSIELLRLVQRAFPVVKYPGVQDSYPLMRPVTRVAPLSSGLSE